MSYSRVWIARVLACAMFVGQPLLAFHPSNQQRAPQKPDSGSLRIVVVSGEDAVNIIQQKTAVAPVVEVRDRNNQPVAGALVTFSIQGGGNATFAGASTVTATTNALGQAAVTSLTPTSAGAVQINVAAAFQGQTATAAITQTNFATAAQAAAAGSGASSGSAAGGGGGGGVGAGTITTLGVVAAGAAGGLYAYRKYEMGEAPNVERLEVFPPVGIQSVTPFSVDGTWTWHGDGATERIDFGDGTIVTVSAPSTNQRSEHVYANAGTYTVRFTLTDAWDRTSSGEATVVVKSLTGRWNVGSTGSFFTLTQSGTTVTGTFTAGSGQGSGLVSGGLSTQGLGSVTLTVTPTGGGSATSFTGTPDPTNADVIGGRITSGATSTIVQLVRQ